MKEQDNDWAKTTSNNIPSPFPGVLTPTPPVLNIPRSVDSWDSLEVEELLIILLYIILTTWQRSRLYIMDKVALKQLLPLVNVLIC